MVRCNRNAALSHGTILAYGTGTILACRVLVCQMPVAGMPVAGMPDASCWYATVLVLGLNPMQWDGRALGVLGGSQKKVSNINMVVIYFLCSQKIVIF